MREERRRHVRRGLLTAAGLAVVVATFFWFLPTVANYGDVWAVVKRLSWAWIAALVLATLVYLASVAPPWLVALPGLRFFQAQELAQASVALSIVVPGGTAAGMAASFGMLRSWRFPRRHITRAMTVIGAWSQFLNLSFPIVALFLLTITGAETALVATVAFIGVAVLGVAITAFVLALSSDRLAREVAELAARLANWALRKVRRGPVPWGPDNFAGFRASAGDLLRRRWHALTLASLAASLSGFLVLLVSLRAVGVSAAEVAIPEAFAAWALVRLLGAIPITPGGIGIVELGLTTALVGFGGDNAGVVAAVLVYRFLTMVPTIGFGLLAAGTWRRHRPTDVEAAVAPPAGSGLR